MGKLCSECHCNLSPSQVRHRATCCSPTCKKRHDSDARASRRVNVAAESQVPARVTLPRTATPPPPRSTRPYTADTEPRPDVSRPPHDNIGDVCVQPADVNDVASTLARMALDLGCAVTILRDGATCILKLNPQLSTAQSISNGQSTDVDTPPVCTLADLDRDHPANERKPRDFDFGGAR